MSAMGRSCLTCGDKSRGGWCRIEQKGVFIYVESRIEPCMKRTTCLWSMSLEKYVLHVYMHMYVFYITLLFCVISGDAYSLHDKNMKLRRAGAAESAA